MDIFSLGMAKLDLSVADDAYWDLNTTSYLPLFGIMSTLELFVKVGDAKTVATD
jgi:hypothetical protein